MKQKTKYFTLLAMAFITISVVAAEPPSLDVVLSKNIEVVLIDGSRAPLSKVLLPGKPTVIEFWATWCSPCIEAIPSFVELNNRYKGQGLQVVGLTIDNPDENLQEVVEVIDKLGMNYVNAFISDDIYRVITGETTVAVSKTLVYDKDGKVVKYFSKPKFRMHKHIERAIKDALNLE